MATLPSGSSSLIPTLVGGHYKLISKIGSGSFGEIHQAISATKREKVAVKLESINSRHPQLENEREVYQILQGVSGIPRSRYFGRAGVYKALVIDLLGPSLETLFNKCSRRFSIKTVLMLADQMIERLEHVHSKGYIHGDVKPDNFLMGIDKYDKKLYLIDFGLARPYRDLETGRHNEFSVNAGFAGTYRYLSIKAHLRCEQSRRDDLESIGYVLIYFLRGRLPWQGLEYETKRQKRERICEIKMTTEISKLCEGYPQEFEIFLKYCRGLYFEQTPDYRYLRRLFSTLFRCLNYKHDYIYDWTNLPKTD